MLIDEVKDWYFKLLRWKVITRDDAALDAKMARALIAVEYVLNTMVDVYVLPTDAPEQRVAMQDGYEIMAEKIRKAIESGE